MCRIMPLFRKFTTYFFGYKQQVARAKSNNQQQGNTPLRLSIYYRGLVSIIIQSAPSYIALLKCLVLFPLEAL